MIGLIGRPDAYVGFPTDHLGERVFVSAGHTTVCIKKAEKLHYVSPVESIKCGLADILAARYATTSGEVFNTESSNEYELTTNVFTPGAYADGVAKAKAAIDAFWACNPWLLTGATTVHAAITYNHGLQN